MYKVQYKLKLRHHSGAENIRFNRRFV